MKKNILIIVGLSLLVISSMQVFSNSQNEKKSMDTMGANIPFPIEKSDALPDLSGKTIEAVTENAFVPSILLTQKQEKQSAMSMTSQMPLRMY